VQQDYHNSKCINLSDMHRLNIKKNAGKTISQTINGGTCVYTNYNKYSRILCTQKISKCFMLTVGTVIVLI